MNRGMVRGALVAALALCGALATPVAAQMFSDGYEFLKAVKERDGDSVTNALSQPGSVIINTRDISTGETALHIVTQRQDPVWVRFLTQKGANPNIADKRGITPIQLAASLGFVDGVEALIKAGARVNVSDDTGETPLIVAVHRRDVAMVKLLLDSGADPLRADNSGRSAREYAELQGNKTQVLAEFERAAAAKSGPAQSYGPEL